MENFEWEQKHESTPLWQHMIAGSIAGLSQHFSMLPLDNVKTHCQVGSRLTLPQIISKIYQAGGLLNFYSGSSVLAMGCIPAHAIYFSIYEKAKKALGCNDDSHQYKFAFVGALSSLFHDLVMTPTEALKQRLQLIRSHGMPINITQLSLWMYRSEGISAFYRSFGINYTMTMPLGAMIIYFNQKIKYLMKVRNNDSYFKYFICAGIAGALASIPTCPLDVIKTRLNTQSCLSNTCQKWSLCNILKDNKQDYSLLQKIKSENSFRVKMNISSEKIVKVRYTNITDTIKKVYYEDGVIGFFSGLKMRVMIQSLSSAIAWGTYQTMKSLIYQVNDLH